jgi:hypothetical protein
MSQIKEDNKIGNVTDLMDFITVYPFLLNLLPDADILIFFINVCIPGVTNYPEV